MRSLTFFWIEGKVIEKQYTKYNNLRRYLREKKQKIVLKNGDMTLGRPIELDPNFNLKKIT